MDVREKYVMQKVNRKEKSICPNCIHHNLCIAENNQPCFECNRFIDAHGVTVQEWIPVKDRLPTAEDANEYSEVLAIDQHGKKTVCQLWQFNSSYRPMYWLPFSALPQPPKGE